MNQLSLENKQLKFKTSGELLFTLEEFIEYGLNNLSKSGRYQHVAEWI
jgi:hypothetical protein